MDLLNIFFPKKCINCKKFGDYLCSDCFTRLDFDVALICGVCGRHAVGGLTHPRCKGRYSIDGIFASLVYRGVSKRLIYQFKFDPYLVDLRHVLGDLFYEGLIQQEVFINRLTNDAVFVPIPLHKSRERGRGYNQASLLANDLSKRFSIEAKSLLIRQRTTPSQVGKTQVERRENIKKVFAPVNLPYIQGKRVFLVDDVVTSGATMNEAAKVLKQAGAKEVYGIALTHGS